MKSLLVITFATALPLLSWAQPAGNSTTNAPAASPTPPSSTSTGGMGTGNGTGTGTSKATGAGVGNSPDSFQGGTAHKATGH